MFTFKSVEEKEMEQANKRKTHPLAKREAELLKEGNNLEKQLAERDKLLKPLVELRGELADVQKFEKRSEFAEKVRATVCDTSKTFSEACRSVDVKTAIEFLLQLHFVERRREAVAARRFSINDQFSAASSRLSEVRKELARIQKAMRGQPLTGPQHRDPLVDNRHE